MSTFNPQSKKFYLYTFYYWIAVFVALFIWSREWPIVRATSGRQEHIFGIFGFFVFSIIIFQMFLDFRYEKNLSLDRKLLIGLPALVNLFFLFVLVEMSQKSWDYRQYENAFRAVVNGNNPYLSSRYLYPPFFSDVMVQIYHFGENILPLLGVSLKKSELWNFVFYIHQSLLYFFLQLSYFLSLKFVRKLNIPSTDGVLLVSAIFIFNLPVLRTISYNQVNFYVLVSILLMIITLSSSQIVSGLAIAFGGLIKIYPFILLFPLIIMRRWKVVLWSLIGGFGVLFVQTNFFNNLLPWKQYLHFFTSFPLERESSWFRNTSLMSLLRSIFELANLPTNIFLPVFFISLVIIVSWFIFRFFQRVQVTSAIQNQEKKMFIEYDDFRSIGSLLDFSVLSLLVAPSAWEHHYILAIPIAIWAYAMRQINTTDWLFQIGIVMVFVMPVFNIFPFSYLRMCGLIFLLIVTSPKRYGENILNT